jgi:hypothetical protein
LLNGQNGSDNKGKHGRSGWKNDGARGREILSAIEGAVKDAMGGKGGKGKTVRA